MSGTKGMAEIRKAEPRDKGAIWRIIRSVIAGGDTYVFTPGSSEEMMMAYWFSPEKVNYVAILDGAVVGTFWLKPNHPGLGSHVANAAYMVAPEAVGRGVGRRMAEFSIQEAVALGFKAMQFNFVVKSNTIAVNLWKSLGFEIIGEIPDAFDHIENGLTNAYIMYRRL
jgi:ribosomal protein S18 acetylase RimI-like enzyme